MIHKDILNVPGGALAVTQGEAGTYFPKERTMDVPISQVKPAGMISSANKGKFAVSAVSLRFKFGEFASIGIPDR